MTNLLREFALLSPARPLAGTGYHSDGRLTAMRMPDALERSSKRPRRHALGSPPTDPEAAVLPVLVPVFPLLLTSLADVTRRVPCCMSALPSRHSFDGRPSAHGSFRSKANGPLPLVARHNRSNSPSFPPVEHRSPEVPLNKVLSRFGTVFNKSHLQGLSPRSWLSYSNDAVSRHRPSPIQGPAPHVAVSESPHASRG
jgi:hypothetical protein